jgi:hypothetical protein
LKTRTGSRYNVTPGIVWALKLQGDINETHAGGDALHALIERLAENGIALERKVVLAAVIRLKKAGVLKVLSQGQRKYAIRLNERALDVLPPNPFEDAKPKKQRKSMVALELEEPAVDLSNGHGELSITQRLQLIEELCVSVREDMEQYKSGVMAGL